MVAGFLSTQSLRVWISFVLLMSLVCSASDIPKNTKVQIRLEQGLSSDTSIIGQIFMATLDRDVNFGKVKTWKKGARVEGVVKYAESTENYRHAGELELELTSVTSEGIRYVVSTSLLRMAGKMGATDPRTGRQDDRGARAADVTRATIGMTTPANGPMATIPGTNGSVTIGGSSTGMQVILPPKSKLAFNLISAEGPVKP